MRSPAEPFRSLPVSRLVLSAAFAIATAGCSGDTGRLDTTFSNPFSSQPSAPETTGSVQPPRQAPNYVESRPLPPQQHYQQPAPSYQQPAPQYQSSAPLPAPPRSSQAPTTYQPASYSPQAAQSGPRNMGPYRPQPDVTGSVPTRPAPRPIVAQPQGPAKQWGWDGGTPISVAQGETIETISKRYGVPSLAIAEANGITTGTPIYPGQRLVIPKYNYAGTQNHNPPAMRPAPQYSAPQQPAPLVTGSVRAMPPRGQAHVHLVAPGETLHSVARRYKVNPVTLASANRLPPHHMLRMGERLTIPGGATRTAMAQPMPQAQPMPHAQPSRPVFQAPQQRIVEAQPPMNSARVITPAKDNPVEEPAAAPAEPAASSAAGFRWPARGRVITGFGPKPTGQQNDGINLAVPEGTPVKAAEDGVVAYAGSELKGYGNLVLVRHSNGYVTAYAHASELMVKRGDTIKRGQTIAKAGQTGTVTSPQVHFEIRKGSSPVDPTQYLNGA